MKKQYFENFSFIRNLSEKFQIDTDTHGLGDIQVILNFFEFRSLEKSTICFN